jgi:tRNA-dihydrouridine synthase B
LISPLILGQQSFPNNIIQGPLAGISCAPFRRLVRQFGEPAFSCTEMISCKTLIYQDLKTQRRFTEIDPQEGPVSFQLASSDPLELAEGVKKVTDLGANLVDLNCGCPVKKIRNKGAGSSLLIDAPKLYQLICAMKQSTHLPVSIKIRVESRDEKFNRDIAAVVSEAGADFLVVHGRHWTEHYETPCRHEEIQFFVEELKIPVIGNGDISCVESLRKMFATGCAGVMIGRAGVGQPWLIKKLMAEMRREAFSTPSAEEISKIFIEHVERLAELLGKEKFAILQARKFAKYYARGLAARNEFCDAINICNNLTDLKLICSHWLRE